jgi:hypothetical protein
MVVVLVVVVVVKGEHLCWLAQSRLLGVACGLYDYTTNKMRHQFINALFGVIFCRWRVAG